MLWKLSIFSLLTLCSILAASCQSKEKTNSTTTVVSPIQHRQYYVRFIEAKKEIQADVSFTTDSKITDADYPRQYFFNDIIMSIKKLPELGITYRYIHEPTVYKPPFVFQYSEANDNIVKDTINMPKLNNLAVADKGFSLSKGGKLIWDKSLSLEQSDILRIIIIDSAGKDYTINHAGATLAGELEISLEQLPQIAKGKASLIISMSRSIVGEKVSKKIEYYYSEIQTEILP